jgi:hypothetical protein
MADVGLGLCRIVGTGIHRSVKRAGRLVQEALICILMTGLPHSLARRSIGPALRCEEYLASDGTLVKGKSSASDVGYSRTLRKRHIG